MILTAKEFPFSDDEIEAMKTLLKAIMDSNIIGGEKTSTINWYLMVNFIILVLLCSVLHNYLLIHVYQ